MLTDTELKEHTLNRLGLGVSAAAAARYDQLGFDAYVNEQLDLATGLSRAQATQFINEARPPAGFSPVPGTETQHREWEYYQRSHLMRPLLTERRLLDVLTDFWWNHFNVAVGSMVEAATYQAWTTQLPGIAERALGRFEDLVGFASLSHSMQSYLDNTQNSVDEPNENLGREILELHTMGIDSGYTQDDVVSASRILTGWFNPNEAGQNLGGGSMSYQPNRHDAEEKLFLGETFPADVDGREEQARLIEMISNHPETYKRISYRLCQKFIADEPPPLLVFTGAIVMSETGGDLLALMRHILFSDEFKDRRYFRAKRKRPRHFGASAALGLGRSIGQVDDARSSVVQIPGVFITYRLKPESALLKLAINGGELLFYNSVPTGYPNVGSYWVSGMMLMRRFEFASFAAANWTDGLGLPNDLETNALVSALEVRMLPGELSEKSKTEVIARVEAADANERLQTAVQMMMISPEFLRF